MRVGFLTRVSVHFHANAKLHCHVSEPDKKKNYSPKTSFLSYFEKIAHMSVV